MQEKTSRFRAVDALLILMIVLPIVFGIVLQIATKPPSEGIAISGARIFFVIPFFFQDIPITESQVNSWIVVVALLGLCLYLTHGIATKTKTRRQHFAEMIVEKATSMTRNNMGEFFVGFAPFIASIMGLSAFSSLMTLVGLYPPTSDINVVAGWAILVFILITYYKLKGGILHYMKSYCEPVPLFAPMNLVSEIATPVSMAFRHYGNVLSGTVISTLVAAALQGISAMTLGWFWGQIPFLQIGIPAVLSLYFDLFSGCLQAFIFAMLTMLYVSGGFPAEQYEKRRLRRSQKKASKAS